MKQESFTNTIKKTLIMNKKLLIITLIHFFISTLAFAQLNTNLLFHWEDTTLIPSWQYDNTYNEIWGVEINDSEFAIIGSTEGTHFFDVSNPASATEVAFIAGAFTGSSVVHRDYHDYNGYLYAVCDEGNTSTLQIMDISNLPNAVSVVYDSNVLFTKSHNIFIDTATAKLYVCAVKHTNPSSFSKAMEIYSLANPVNPTLLHTYDDVGHVHDAYVKNDTAYLNCGNDGLRIIDFSMLGTPLPVQPNLLATLTAYPDAGYNHSGWLNDDGTKYVMLDENHGYDIKLLDVSDFNNVTVLSTFNSGVDAQSMAHNAIIKDNYIYVSYYHDGLRVFNFDNPSNPNQVAYYDTYAPTSHASYKGAWGVYPYFSSGNVLISDMQTGLYVFDCQLGVSSVNDKEIEEISIYPNPATHQITIQNNTADNFILYNSLGTAVMNKAISTNQTTISRGNLTNGLYFYSLDKEGEQIESGKILFE